MDCSIAGRVAPNWRPFEIVGSVLVECYGRVAELRSYLPFGNPSGASTPRLSPTSSISVAASSWVADDFCSWRSVLKLMAHLHCLHLVATARSSFVRSWMASCWGASLSFDWVMPELWAHWALFLLVLLIGRRWLMRLCYNYCSRRESLGLTMSCSSLPSHWRYFQLHQKPSCRYLSS